MTLTPAQLFFSPDISGPNNSQLSPLNRIICNLFSAERKKLSRPVPV